MIERAGVEARFGFKAHPHMLRHACGYALANKGHDTRSLQAYLGHKNIQHTVRYTELSPADSEIFGGSECLPKSSRLRGGGRDLFGHSSQTQSFHPQCDVGLHRVGYEHWKIKKSHMRMELPVKLHKLTGLHHSPCQGMRRS